MSSLSLNQKKLIRSLARKKSRNELGLFMVEGDKMVGELIRNDRAFVSFQVRTLMATSEWLDRNREEIGSGTEIIELKTQELKQVSVQREPKQALAIVHMAVYQPDIKMIRDSLVLGLEGIQDPGNMGTIIRTADWFGIRDILCSEDCVELYNPKVIQSTMGSFTRVRIHYLDLFGITDYLKERVPGSTEGERPFPVYASSADGENIHGIEPSERGMILLGNESRGLSAEMMEMADRILRIPPYDASLSAESLNVASACAVFCSFFRAPYSK